MGLSGCAPSAVLGDAGYKKELGFSPLSVGLSAVAVALSGVTNRVAHKVASVVFSEFILVLSLVLIVAYIVVYFSALYARMKKGVVTKKMLAYPKWKFGFLGLVDALGLVMQLSAAVHLPGAIIPVLAQINIPFSLLVSRVVLKREFYLNQLAGCFLVIIGVLLSLKPYVSSTLLNGTGHSLGFNAVLYSSSYLFAAIAACVKEGILHNTDYGEEGVDLFVVSSFGSLAQGIVVLSMIFLVSLAQGTLPGMGDLSPAAYLKSGLGCFKENPLPPLVYVCCNILFNVNVVNLVKKSNAVLTTLSIAFVVPLSFIAFSFPTNVAEGALLHRGPQGLVFAYLRSSHVQHKDAPHTKVLGLLEEKQTCELNCVCISIWKRLGVCM